MDGEGFVYVNRASRRGKGRGKGRMRHSTPPVFSDLLERTREQLVSSGWWNTYRAEIVPEINRASKSIVGSGDTEEYDGGGRNEASSSRWKCLCLGLGRPTSSIEARAQLSVLLDLCDELQITPTDTELFDPAFEDADVAGLSDLGLRVMSENKKGAYVIDTPTLVFMPHCGVELYERFLRANWSGSTLARVLLVANDLGSYAESTPARRLEARSPCVAKLGKSVFLVGPYPPPRAPAPPVVNHSRSRTFDTRIYASAHPYALSHSAAPRLESTLFPPSTALPGAFNSTALQVLARADDYDHAGAWTLPPPPEADAEEGDGEVR
ncbi:hypothetical protein FRC07_011240 [Ceratobasidium sp. 392]|nr:hypothetical protein FRC07_011240 [Ceratobasidium sp. 392]